MSIWAELAGEHEELSLLELRSVLKEVSPASPDVHPLPFGRRLFELESQDPQRVGRRLGLTYRLLEGVAEGSLQELRQALREKGSQGLSAAIRPGRGENIPDDVTATLGKAHVEGGGTIDLAHPDLTYVLFRTGWPEGVFSMGSVVASTRRSYLKARKPGNLPFRKPVTLSPLLASVMVNLTGVAEGGLILDPFCGTGAILIEAGLMGFRLAAADLDGRMIKGTLTNLAGLGLTPEVLLQCDVGCLAQSLAEHAPVDGVATDPPYGRASSTHGEEARSVTRKALGHLPDVVRRGGRVVMMVPAPEVMDPLPDPWMTLGDPVPLRVHQSLTRWLFVLVNGST